MRLRKSDLRIFHAALNAAQESPVNAGGQTRLLHQHKINFVFKIKNKRATMAKSNPKPKDATPIHDGCFHFGNADLIAAGYNFSIRTFKTLASTANSESPTHRICPSMRAMMSRETSHPFSWHFAASCGCDNPSCVLKRLTCGPQTFRGFLAV